MIHPILRRLAQILGPIRTAACLAAALFALPAASFAGSINASNSTLSVSLSGVVDSSAANPPDTDFSISTFTFSGGNAVKLSGDQFYSDTDGGGGSITISFSGTVSVNPNDIFSVRYIFSLDLGSAAGTVVPRVQTSGKLGNLTLFSSNDALPAGGPGITNYSGVLSANAGAASGTLTFNASVIFTVAGDAPGDTLRIDIPNNSIDFAVASTALTIPEPGSSALLLLVVPFLARRRRS